jgi:hypothetical protein
MGAGLIVAAATKTICPERTSGPLPDTRIDIAVDLLEALAIGRPGS